MVKFINNWMFASRIWMQNTNHSVYTIVFLKDGNGIPIDGNTIEIFAEFQKYLQTIRV